MWHSRLGHPSLRIFRKFLSFLNISFPEEHFCSFSYNSCNINKSHKLPFAKSSIISSSPLDIVFSDVWTLLVSSSDGFNYYVIFVDHCTKYILLYPYVENRMFIQPLSRSSNLLKTISPPIKAFYTDNGGEFLAL